MRLYTILILCGLSVPAIAQNRSSEITCEPYFENKKIVGFTCPEMHEESLLSKMGLQSSDIIVGYNGKSIASYKDMQKFYEQLHVKGKMQVKYKRKNKVLNTENLNR